MNLSGNLMNNSSNEELEVLFHMPTQSNLYTMVATTVLLTVIAVVGIIGNSLVIWAFRCEVTQGIVSSLLILVLAFLDLTICLVGVPSTMYLDIWIGDTTDWICRAHMAFKGFVVPVSACLLVLIALERFLLICFIPGVKLKKSHLYIAFTFILLVGVILSAPMALHSKAVRMAKERDELLDLYISLSVTNLLQRLKTEKHIPKRCGKDDYHINDKTYWYYQILVMILFASLFALLLFLYGTTFLFVWRHESLMFERYGKSKYRGYWIRIYASNPSSKKSNREEGKPTEVSMCASQRPIEKMNGIQTEPNGFRCACCSGSDRNDVSFGSQISIPRPVTGQTEIQETTQRKPWENSPLISFSQTKSGESYKTEHSDELIVCSYCCCSKIRVPRDSSPASAFNHTKLVPLQSIENVPDARFPQNTDYKTRATWAVQTMEHRRRPYVRTAQTFAVIAAAFMLSYTPYMVYTSIPISKRNIPTFIEKEKWYVEVGHVLFFLYFTNSAANPIIYSCMNRHFRSRMTILRTIICRLLNIKQNKATQSKKLGSSKQIIVELQTVTKGKMSTTVRRHTENEATLAAAEQLKAEEGKETQS
ncbi:unnamed protein product [Dicrocoelium dendriticum]|nr:unnamed protein product [Dicrocoelium dendriticum]